MDISSISNAYSTVFHDSDDHNMAVCDPRDSRKIVVYRLVSFIAVNFIAAEDGRRGRLRTRPCGRRHEQTRNRCDLERPYNLLNLFLLRILCFSRRGLDRRKPVVLLYRAWTISGVNSSIHRSIPAHFQPDTTRSVFIHCPDDRNNVIVWGFNCLMING